MLGRFGNFDRKSGPRRGTGVSALAIVLTVHFSNPQHYSIRETLDDARQPSKKQSGKRAHRDQRD